MSFYCVLCINRFRPAGIDVQAELQAKAGSPNLGSAHVPQNIVQPPPIQRPIMNRNHHNRKSNSSIAPKVEPSTVGPSLPAQKPTSPPKSRPTPSSHSDSPNPGSGFSPAPSDSISMRGSISGLARQQMSVGGAGSVPRGPLLQLSTPRSSVANVAASLFPTSAFQNHVEQLGESSTVFGRRQTHRLMHLVTEHEYDNHADMVDDSEIETPSGRSAFGGAAFNSDTTQPMLLSPTSTGPAHHEQGGHHASIAGHPFPTMTQLLDQNLDWDPFGLSASMAFPGQQYPFDQASMR